MNRNRCVGMNMRAGDDPRQPRGLPHEGKE